MMIKIGRNILLAGTLCCAGLNLSAQFVEIAGRGRVTYDPPPPHQPGQEVRLTFSPSTGVRTAAKPDAPPATDPADPCAGWVFGHWSWSATDTSTLPQPYNGLENPVIVNVPSEGRKLHATFLPLGTLAHPTARQEGQLRVLAQGRFIGWDGLTPIQVRELARKSDLHLDQYRRYHEKWGQTASVLYADFGRTREFSLDYLGEGATWTGLHLASLALKWRALGGDATTLADINRALDAFDVLVRVTGTSGRIARFAGPPEDKAYWEYASHYRLGHHRGTPPYEHLEWLGWPSRDTYIGSFAGFGTLLALVDDPGVHARVVGLVTLVVDRLLADDWEILDGTGKTTANNRQLKAVIRRVALSANPEKYRAFAAEVEGHKLSVAGLRDLDHKDYWVNNLEWSRLLALVLLTPPGPQRTQFAAAVREDFEKVRFHFNLGWTAIAWLLAGDLGPDAAAQLQGGLLSYPDPPKWKMAVDLTLDPGKHPPRSGWFGEDEKHVLYPALPAERVVGDYNWHRSAALKREGRFSDAYVHTAFDFQLAYWAGRVAGVIPAPSPDSSR